jgi:hypothetical protein
VTDVVPSPGVRVIGLVLVGVLLVAGCGDDGGPSASSDRTTSVTTGTTPAGPLVGPTTASTEPPDCLVLAREYVMVATGLFSGPPDDDVVEASRGRFRALDGLAAAGGCGDGYRQTVCDGLDELTRSGTLVIYPMVTARCL